MKKILGISLVAMMAVTAANAEIASKAYVIQEDNAIKADIGTLSGLTTTEKGTVVGAINELVTKTGTGSVDTQISDAIGALDAADTKGNQQGSVVKSVAEADGVISATYGYIGNDDVASDAAIASSKLASGLVAQGNGVGVARDSSTGVYTVSVSDASTSAKGIIEIATDQEASDGLSESLAVNPKQLKAVADSVTSGAVNSISLESGTNNGTVKLTVDDVATDNIAITGLGSAAFTDSGAYDSAGTAAAAIEDLDYTGASGGNVITQVTQTDGTVAATMGKAIMQFDSVTTNGTHVLTMTRTGDAQNGYTYTYGWEVIQRETPAQEPANP